VTSVVTCVEFGISGSKEPSLLIAIGVGIARGRIRSPFPTGQPAYGKSATRTRPTRTRMATNSNDHRTD